MEGMRQIYILLHNIRSVHNVGSIFRTADAAGVSQIFLSGYTPAPLDRFGREVKGLSKTALGGELSVKWEQVKSPIALINRLKKSGVRIIGIEQDRRSLDYKKMKINKRQPVLFIVGNEVDGMPKNILQKCDTIAEIPMKGKKESLNVGVSFGIAVFRMLNI